jgi:uncharacterized protein (DUF1810 family)
MSDGDGLERYAAQDEDGTYERAIAELRAGAKRTHWMWFVLPQIAGLGSSPTARRYAIRSLEEARAYLAHPVLGSRLIETAAVVRDAPATDAGALLGSIDAQKLRSSMTLFARAAPGEPVFQAVLDRWFDGVSDPATDERI